MSLYFLLKDFLFLIPILYAGFEDFKKGKIPNEVIFPCAMGALMTGIVEGGPAGGFLAFKNGVLLALPLFVIYKLNGMGAGDVKMAFVIGAWMGLSRGLHFLVYSCAFGLVAGFSEMFSRKEVISRLRYWFAFFTFRAPGEKLPPVSVPFGGAMAFSAFYMVIERVMGW